MRLTVPMLMLAAVACSRSDAPKPEAVASATMTPPAAVPVPAGGSDRPSYTLVGICNKLRAADAVTYCAPDDAGTEANFRKGKGQGVINIAKSRAVYDRILNSANFQGMQLATSEENLVIVFWTTTGDELSDGLIRTVVATL